LRELKRLSSKHKVKHADVDKDGYVLAFADDFSGRDELKHCFETLGKVDLAGKYLLKNCMAMFPNGRDEMDVKARRGNLASEKSAEDDFNIKGAAQEIKISKTLTASVKQGDFAMADSAVIAPPAISAAAGAGQLLPESRISNVAASSILQTRFRRDTEDSGSVASGRTASDASGSKVPRCYVCRERSGKLLGCTTCSRHYDRRCFPGPESFGDDWQCPGCKKKGVSKKRRVSEMINANESSLEPEDATSVKRLRLGEDVGDHVQDDNLQSAARPEALTELPSVPRAIAESVAIPDSEMDDIYSPAALSAQDVATELPKPQESTSLVQAQAQAGRQERVEPDDLEIDLDLDGAASLVDESFNTPTANSTNLKKVKQLSLVVRKVTRPAVSVLSSPSRNARPPDTDHASAGATTAQMTHEPSDAPATEQESHEKTGENLASNSDKVGLFTPDSRQDLIYQDVASKEQEVTPRSAPPGRSRPSATDAVKPDVLANHLRDTDGSASPVDSVMQQAQSFRAFAKKTKSRVKTAMSKCTTCKSAYVPENPWGYTECTGCLKEKSAVEADERIYLGANQSPALRNSGMDDEQFSRAPSLAASVASANLPIVAQEAAVSFMDQHSATTKLASSNPACEDCRRRKQHCVHRQGASSIACDDCRRAHIRCVHQPKVRRPVHKAPKKGLAVRNSRQRSPDSIQGDHETFVQSEIETEPDEAQGYIRPEVAEVPRRKHQIRRPNSRPASPDPPAKPAEDGKNSAPTHARDLGNSFHRPPGVYRRLICMAFCDTPSRSLTARGVADWVDRNIPGYNIRESNWAAGLMAVVYGQDKVKGDTRCLKRVDWEPSFGGDAGGVWFALMPGMELKVEHWDAALGQPVSPPKSSLSQTDSIDGEPQEESADQSNTPSKSKSVPTSTTEGDEIMLTEHLDSGEEDADEGASSQSGSSMSFDEDAMNLDSSGENDVDGEEKSSESSDEEPLSAIHRRSFQARRADEDVIMDEPTADGILKDPTPGRDNRPANDVHRMNIGTPTTTRAQAAPIAQMTAPTLVSNDPPPSTTINQDRPFDHDLWNFIRDLPSSPPNPSLSLSESYPEHFFDRRAKLAEIRARPSRKQQINARIANLYGKGGGVVDTTVQRQRDEQLPHRVLETDTGVTELKNDVRTLTHCSTLEEFLGTGQGLVADVVDVSLMLLRISCCEFVLMLHVSYRSN
jgi:hypothetical protein